MEDRQESRTKKAATFTGTEVSYYFICKKKLWWFAHGVEMEHSSDRVEMGKLVHQESYGRRKKELNLDDRIVIDWREDGVIHEVKLTDKMEAAHEMQLLYYLYYLKHVKGVVASQATENLYRAGYCYKKAGVMLNALVPSDQLTLRMFHQDSWERSRRVSAAMDEINKKYGRHTIRYGSVKTEGRWQMKAAHRSPHYTTRLNELLTIDMDKPLDVHCEVGYEKWTPTTRDSILCSVGGIHDGEVTQASLHERVSPAGGRNDHA